MTALKNLYLNKAQLKAELDRCLNCKNQPCMNACPVNCNPQEFINHAKSGEYKEAVKTISRNNPLGQTCGLICPDKFCMRACTRSKIDFAINIPKVQATLLQNFRQLNDGYPHASPLNIAVAVIGAGPAGMAAAALLSENGFNVTVFESQNQIGGALNLIPQSRLPHTVIEKDWGFISQSPLVDLKLNTPAPTPDKLLKLGFQGVVVASGEPNVTMLSIKGEEYTLSFMEYLRNPEKYVTNGNVAVIGGGAVAVDCALTAKAAGANEVEMFVRRRISDMKITRAEREELLENNIDITTMTSPIEAAQQGELYSLFTCKNQFVEGRLVPLNGSVIERPGFSYIIKAVGSYADRKTDSETVIYAGDVKHGGSTIVEAIASGREAATVLSDKLSSQIPHLKVSV